MPIPPASCDTLASASLSVEQAQQRILANITPLQLRERLALRQAHGRILADTITASFDVPPHHNSSMDGYAYAHSDAATCSHLTVIGRSLAGHPHLEALTTGQCVRIMTGAMLPPGADTVVMQENVQSTADSIQIIAVPQQGDNVRYPGDDLRQGDAVLKAGRVLNAADLGLLASLGIGEVDVLRRPRVAFFSTGDELKPIGSVLGPSDIHDSNRYTLYGLLNNLAVECLDMGIIPDQTAAVEQAFRDASTWADVLITSGGVSVGDADYVTATLQQLGKVDFWKLAMKPGKPLAHGHIGNSLFFGLPGNPVSVMATFMLFVRPAILKLRGEQVVLPTELPAITQSDLHKTPGRKEYQRGICSQTDSGQWQVSSTGLQESHVLRSMSQANCFIVLPQDCGDLPSGSAVSIIPFAGLM